MKRKKKNRKEEKRKQLKSFSWQIQWAETPIRYLQQQKVAQKALLQGSGMLHSSSSLEKLRGFFEPEVASFIASSLDQGYFNNKRGKG